MTNANENITGTYYGDWGMQVKILETGEVYSDGEFVANLLYQGWCSTELRPKKEYEQLSANIF